MSRELKCARVDVPVPAVRSIEFHSGESKNPYEEVYQLTGLRTCASIRGLDDDGHTGFVFIGAHMKDTLARREFVVITAVSIVVEAGGVELANIIKTLFVSDGDHGNSNLCVCRKARNKSE